MFKPWFRSLVVLAFLVPAFADLPKRMVILGDSLTEGLGVSHEEAYPALLQKKSVTPKKKWTVINAGISGSTSASAPSRMTWQMKHKPDLILLVLGANDGLRGTSVKAMEENLAAALEICHKNSVKVILVGIKIPPNYGADYTSQFDAVFPRLAKRFNVPLIPFLLLNVAGIKDLNQPDGIHPNSKGHAIVAETIYQAIQKNL